MMLPNFISPDDAAQTLQISREELERLCAAGALLTVPGGICLASVLSFHARQEPTHE